MRKIKVMLVDDEPAICNIMKLTIPWESCNMEVAGVASSGVEALNKMEEVEPELVIADIKMPFMDGLTFSRIALKQNPDLAVIVLTAYEDFELAREALRIGVADYFVKPVEPDDILERLKKVEQEILERRKAERENIVINIENPDKVVSKINRYILENYQDPELNVASLAEQFGFERSYLSRMYKKETGKLLIDYLIECRMEIAKKLAQTGQKMYMTAEKVGIPDANYFGKCFKKYTGMSYRDYQKEAE